MNMYEALMEAQRRHRPEQVEETRKKFDGDPALTAMLKGDQIKPGKEEQAIEALLDMVKTIESTPGGVQILARMNDASRATLRRSARHN